MQTRKNFERDSQNGKSVERHLENEKVSKNKFFVRNNCGKRLSGSDEINFEATPGQTTWPDKISSHSRLSFERNEQKRKEKFEEKRKVSIYFSFHSLLLLCDLTPRSYKLMRSKEVGNKKMAKNKQSLRHTEGLGEIKIKPSQEIFRTTC